MNGFARHGKTLTWVIGLLAGALIAGCGDGSGGSGGSGGSDARAITSYSINGASGTINEAGKTIAVTLPAGTNVTALVATFAKTGVVVTVGITPQVSAITANDFTSPVAYTVVAENLATATYTVTVTLAAAVGTGVCTGASCVDLGSAANYVILDEATVTFTPIATIATAPTITGNVGLSPAAASFITGFALAMDPAMCFSTSTQVTGRLYAADYSSVNGCATATTDTATILTAAIGDKNTAYAAAAGRAGTAACPGAGGNITGTPLAAGVYTCALNVTIPVSLTLNGSATDVWVFQITGTLDQSAATSVFLTGGALPENVFWQVSGGVTIGAGAHMEGVLLSNSGIALLTGATARGRLLARTGVLLDANTVVQP